MPQDITRWWTDREGRAFHEKTWQRSGLAVWDAKWHALSPAARRAFLNEVPVPTRKKGAPPAGTPVECFPEKALDELVRAKFVEIRPAGASASAQRVVVADEAIDFARRVQELHRLHLLSTERADALTRYVKQNFHEYALHTALAQVLQRAGIMGYLGLPELLRRYVAGRRWPGWVAEYLHSPVAAKVLAAVQEAGGSLPLTQLAERVPKSKPDAVRSALDNLVALLALFEDVQPGTGELLVGLLPAVRADLERAGRPRERPPLVPCPSPREVGPEGGFLIADLRAVLLELAREPAKVRQNFTLYQKDYDRLAAALEDLPGWLVEAVDATAEARLDAARQLVQALRLTEIDHHGAISLMRISAQGQKWLTSPLDVQYASVFDYARARPSSARLLDDGASGCDGYDYGDSRFLGVTFSVSEARRGLSYYSHEVTPAERQALREAFDRAFAALPIGTFIRRDSFLAHAAYGPHNPLLMGRAPTEVVVFRYGARVPPLEDELEEAGRQALDECLQARLVPLGCFRAALDERGELCVARQPRLDAYFGREVSKEALAGTGSAEARVIVQPDYSIVLIGLNPTPVAELSPFCERPRGRTGPGSMVLKLTRDAVVKAIAGGLEPGEIVARLQRHASNELPANVLREVEGWCRWAKRVEPAPMLVLRCPDRDTADRVTSALRRRAERLSETLVAVADDKLTSADRQKLEQHGIIVDPSKARGPAPRKRRGSR